jgi:hypothetical protein
MERPDDSGTAHDPAGRIIDDNTAETQERAVERSLADLKAASQNLKARILDEKRRNEMPIDSALGNPKIEQQNADGRNDLPDVDDD